MTEPTLQPLAPVRRQPEIPRPLQRAARQLEAAFTAEMLKAARGTPRDGMFTGGTGAHTFDSFMDDALGDAMAQRGGIGLAPHIARSLARQRTTPTGQE